MQLNDLLNRRGIDPSTVLILRHRPIEPSFRRLIRALAVSRHEMFNAYQQTQTPQVEAAMQRAQFVLSLIGHEPGQALFVGLYERGNWRPLTKDGYWSMPMHQELRSYGCVDLLTNAQAFYGSSFKGQTFTIVGKVALFLVGLVASARGGVGLTATNCQFIRFIPTVF